MFKRISIALAVLATPALAQEVINPQALFPEGPVMQGGSLYYAEYAGQVVQVWDGAANRVLWQQDGCGPSAVVPMGVNFGITCYDSGQLVVISPDGQTIASHDKDAAGGGLLGPNDGTPDGQGGAWFTLSGPWEAGPIVGRVVHLGASGAPVEVANDLHYANGVALGADGRLYVNESEAGRVISFAVGVDFTLSDRRVFARLYQLGEAPGVYPDGLKLGPNGNFFVGEYSAGRIVELAPDGTLVRVHEVSATATPNMAFSADGKTMYVMAVDNTAGAPYEGRVLAVPLN
jgi:gluconolactonase